MNKRDIIKLLENYDDNQEINIEIVEQPFAGARLEYHLYEIDSIESNCGDTYFEVRYIGRNNK